jgi:hypothetical protein
MSIDSEDTIFHVVRNHEEQYAIRPVTAKPAIAPSLRDRFATRLLHLRQQRGQDAEQRQEGR